MKRCYGNTNCVQEARNVLSLKIFKFREDKSNNVFREIRKCLRKTAKFEFFAKQIIYLGSPDHVLQSDI